MLETLRDITAYLDPKHHELAAGIDDFAERCLDPLDPAEDDEAGRAQAREILASLGREGWGRLAVPAEGEAAPDLRSCCLARERIAYSSPLGDAVFALQCLGTAPLAAAGSVALRSEWLERVAAGEAMAAFAMTEPEAGSDVGAMRTVARKVDGGYELDGRKWLISNAGIADFYTVFASLDPKAKARGIACFFVPANSSGLRFVGPQKMSEPHPLGEIAFESCRVPDEHLLAGAGEGFKLGMRTLDRLRVTVAAAACGMAGRALDEAIRHAMGRRQFGGTMADLQLVQAKLATMKVDLTASRLLTYRAAAQADAGADGGPENVTLRSAMAKLFSTEAAQKIVDSAIQIIGGRGVLAEHVVDRLYRSVRALRIYEGASEVQQLVIARQMLKEKA